MTKRLSAADREAAMLAALRAIGGEGDRAAIAAHIGRKRLNPADLAVLSRLEEKGLIEVQRVDRPGLIPYSWIYRVEEE